MTEEQGIRDPWADVRLPPPITWTGVVVAKMPGYRGHMYYKPQRERDKGTAANIDQWARSTREWVIGQGGTIVRIQMVAEP